LAALGESELIQDSLTTADQYQQDLMQAKEVNRPAEGD
jgi:hypothetical protein